MLPSRKGLKLGTSSFGAPEVEHVASTWHLWHHNKGARQTPEWFVLESSVCLSASTFYRQSSWSEEPLRKGRVASTSSCFMYQSPLFCTPPHFDQILAPERSRLLKESFEQRKFECLLDKNRAVCIILDKGNLGWSQLHVYHTDFWYMNSGKVSWVPT